MKEAKRDSERRGREARKKRPEERRRMEKIGR